MQKRAQIGRPIVSILIHPFVDPLCKMLNESASGRINEGLGNLWICGGTKIVPYGDTWIFVKVGKEHYAI